MGGEKQKKMYIFEFKILTHLKIRTYLYLLSYLIDIITFESTMCSIKMNPTYCITKSNLVKNLGG